METKEHDIVQLMERQQKRKSITENICERREQKA